MKKTRRLSFLVAMIIAITNIACIAMPVGAADADVIVSDDFEGYSADAATPSFAAMQEICDMNPWWYSSSTNVYNKFADLNENTPTIASVVEFGGSNALKLDYHATAGVGTNLTNPSKANYFEYGNGSYEVSFKFYATGTMQILGVGGQMVDGVAKYYAHNILSKISGGAYMGDTETTSPGCPGGSGISSNTWYTLKIVVNNDQGYYSVDLMNANGVSLQRVGGINFKDDCPAISNIRFQAQTEGSVVYIDDYAVKKVGVERLLYEDDFNIYSALATTKKEGYNAFKEISQFRIQDKNSSIELSSKSLKLNPKIYKETTHYPANVMYMPWNGYILTKETQNTRGTVQMKFSFCVDESAVPAGTSASFRVISADKFSTSNIPDLANDNYTMFRAQCLSSDGTNYGVQLADNGDSAKSYLSITKGTWYNVQMTYDLINDKVTVSILDTPTNKVYKWTHSTGLYNGGTPLEAIKSIMFKANDGMTIDVDDFELKYVPDALKVTDAGVTATDFNGEKIANGATGVNPAIASIKVPFTVPVTDESVKAITLKAENSEDAFTGYTSSNSNGVYGMSFNKPLAPNTKYILTVPATVTSIQGVSLAQPYTYEFTTGAAVGVEMGIVAVSAKTVEELKNDSKIQVKTRFANTTQETANCMMIVGYYDADGTMLASTGMNGDLAADKINLNYVAPATVPNADKLDMSKVERISIYIWDKCDSIRPYCESVDILRTATDSE